MEPAALALALGLTSRTLSLLLGCKTQLLDWE